MEAASNNYFCYMLENSCEKHDASFCLCTKSIKISSLVDDFIVGCHHHAAVSCAQTKIYTVYACENFVSIPSNCIVRFILIYHVRYFTVEFWTYVEKSFTWTDLPSKFPTKYVQFPVTHSLLLVLIIHRFDFFSYF